MFFDLGTSDGVQRKRRTVAAFEAVGYSRLAGRKASSSLGYLALDSGDLFPGRRLQVATSECKNTARADYELFDQQANCSEYKYRLRYCYKDKQTRPYKMKERFRQIWRVKCRQKINKRSKTNAKCGYENPGEKESKPDD